MSSPDRSSPLGGIPQDEKPRLTEEQKRQNHITSEQKRRQAIRDGFDKLAEIVPGIQGQGRSEGHVLNVSVQHILEQLDRRSSLIQDIEARGGTVPEHLKEYVPRPQSRVSRHDKIVADGTAHSVLRIDLSKVNLEHLGIMRPEQVAGPANGANGANGAPNGT